jgi:hypothetical protein
LAVLAAAVLPCFAAASPKCVLIVLPAGGWLDTAPLTREALLSIDGAAGSLSCAVPRPMTQASAWVTLGAGNRAVWPEGKASPTSLAVRDPLGRMRFLQSLREANARLPYPIEIASMGQTLRGAGYRTALVGLGEPWQLAAVMDADGNVDSLRNHASAAEVQEEIDRADYIVVNGGAAEGDAQLAELIGAAATALSPQDLLIVAALAPREAPFDGLAPIVARGPVFAGSLSQLTSATTRRSGIVANIDLPPTVLHYFGLPAPASYRNGAVMGISGRLPLNLKQAVELDVRGRRVNTFRNLILPLGFLLQAVFVPLAVARRWPRSPRSRAALMFALMLLPAASHLTAVLPFGWPKLGWLAAILATAALGGLIVGLRGKTTSRAVAGYAFIAAGTIMLVLIADQSAGAPLQPLVPLGYALGFGGRFYGIGNEASGLLMAAGVIAAGLVSSVSRDTDAASRWVRRLVTVLLAVCPIVVIAHPTLGADAGGTLASVICVGAFFMAVAPGRRKWLWGVAVVALAAGALVVVARFDATGPPETMTHVGRAWLRLSTEGGPYCTELVRRKVATAWNTMRLVPALSLICLWVLFWTYALLRPLGFVRRAYQALPAVRAPLLAVAVGGLAAALLNDSAFSIPMTTLDFALPLLGLAALAGTEPASAAKGTNPHE